MTEPASIPDPVDVTQLLVRASRGDQAALSEVTPVVYEELRRCARAVLRGRPVDQTLRTTAMVNEAWLKLAGHGQIDVRARQQFFGLAAKVMRNLMLDQARRQGAAKRGGDVERVPLSDQVGFSLPGNVDIVGLHEALERLAEFDERKARVVELRFFAGLENGEIAEVLEVSIPTVERDWRMAKTWLYRELSS